MSSFFKKWNTKKASAKGKEKENTENKTKSSNFEEGEEFDLPPSFPRRPDRNMSISRSGRHKMKQRQRTSVMSDELYSPEGASNRQQASSARQQSQDLVGWSSSSDQVVPGSNSLVQSSAPSGSGGGYHCRETVDSTAGNLSGSQRMARAPTAV